MNSKQYTTMFDQLIDTNNLVDSTQEQLFECLANMWDDNFELFIQELGENLTTVLRAFAFPLEGIAVNRKFYKGDSLDFITVTFQIIDLNAATLGTYTAYYNFDMECFDDYLVLD